MGQFLVVQGAKEEREEGLLIFRRALSLFETLCYLKPCDQLSLGSTAIAKFPRLLAGTPGIVRNAPSSAWICGAGTCIYQGLSGEDSLNALSGKLQGPNEAVQSVLADIDGIFTLACGGNTAEELLLVTDRTGRLHVYLTRVGPCLVVSTSSMVLAALIRPEWDPVSYREFLATGTVFENRTLFKAIEKLEPATVFRFRNGHLSSRFRYWDLAAIMYDRAPKKGNVPQLATALLKVCSVLSRAFRKPLFDLTGGYDTRALVGAMLRVGNPFETAVSGSENEPDVMAAKRIAREFGLRLHHMYPELGGRRWWMTAKASLPLCDGEYDILEYARILDIHSRLAVEFDVSVNGSGGEICKGYWWELLFPFTGCRNRFDERLVAARRFAVDQWSADLMEGEFSDTLVDHFATVIRHANSGLEEHPNTAKMDNVYLTLRMQRWQGRIASATSRLWPCVSPFMFREPMEIALSAPPAIRVRHRMTRRLIEYLDPRLAMLPLAQGYPAVPLRLRSAHLFAPLVVEGLQTVAKRLRSFLPVFQPLSKGKLHTKAIQPWQEEIRDLLNPSTMVTRPLYKTKNLRRFLDLSSHDGFAETSHLGRILTLELLARTVRM